MESIFYIILFIFGAIFGSFVNSQADRWGTTRFESKRSKCFQCGSPLVFMELIPVFSWLSQKGRCRTCRGKLPSRLILIEVIMGALFVVVGVVSGSTAYLIISLTLVVLLVALTLTDLDHFLIPHGLSVPFILLSLSTVFINYQDLSLQIPTLWHLLAGPILAAFFWSLWFFSQGRAMGFADGTLALGMGWLLGLAGGVTAVILSFWIGSVVSLLLIGWQNFGRKAINSDGEKNQGKRLTIKSAVPFGPFLVIGCLLVYLFHVTLPFIYI